MPKVVISLMFLALLIQFSACTNNKKELLLGTICDTSDTKFSTVIQPLFNSKCISCHNNGNAMGGVSLEGYDNVKTHYANSISNMQSGAMPKNGSRIDDCSILKVQTWVNRGAQNN